MIAILSTVPGSVCLTSSCIGPERSDGREMSRILTIGNHAIIERERPLNGLAIAYQGKESQQRVEQRIGQRVAGPAESAANERRARPSCPTDDIVTSWPTHWRGAIPSTGVHPAEIMA